jgi:heat shock protein HslJ
MSEQRVRGLARRGGRARRRLAVTYAATAVAAVVAGIAYLLLSSLDDVTPTAQELRGRLFMLAKATEADRSPSDPMRTGKVSLEFTSDDRYVARTGCFIMSGRVRAEGGRLALSHRQSRFSSACDNVMVAYNPLFTRLLETNPSYRLNGDALTLTSRDIEIVLRGLVGRTFLSTGVEETGKSSDLLGNARVRLEFTSDGELRADVGCNQLLGPVDVRDWRIQARLGTTDMACDRARAQETWLREFLATQPNWRLDGPELVLTGGGYQLRLVDAESD